MEARSIALVGASPREGSFGEMLVMEAQRGEYAGKLYAVNPKYDTEILGVPAFRSIADIPEPVDLAVLGVGNHLIEDAMRDAISAGARSAAIFASLYEEPSDGPDLKARLGTMARDADIAVVGGNCMGFLQNDLDVRVCGFVNPPLDAGPITFISHSGSVFAAFAWNRRQLGFNTIVSAGQEVATTTADYMHYALGLESTKVIGLFLETVRDPDNFKEALIRAADKDIPVIAMKVGKSDASREMVAAHSGALAGEDGAYEALFEAYGVQRVNDLATLADTLELFSRNGRRAAPGKLTALNDSGGERAMLVDAADEADVEFAHIDQTTVSRLESVLEEGLPPVNPLDAWGTGNDARAIFVECMRALHDDGAASGLAFVVDMTPDYDNDEDYTSMALDVFPTTTKPFAFLSNLHSAIHPPDAERMRAEGIPVLEGTMSGLAAFRHLNEYRDFRLLPPVADPPLPQGSIRTKWRDRLTAGEALSEAEGLALLGDYGVPVIPAELVTSREGAEEAVEKFGYPVALKTAVPGIQHKSDVGGVKLGIRSEHELAGVYNELASKLGPEVLVSPMAPQGVELALGIVRDPQFGPLVLVAAGGILVELLKDRRLAMPPLDEARARRLIDGLKTRELLDGVRGAPASDVGAVARAVVALGALAHDLGDLIDGLDANPLIAGPDGCIAVDALVIPRS